MAVLFTTVKPQNPSNAVLKVISWIESFLGIYFMRVRYFKIELFGRFKDSFIMNQWSTLWMTCHLYRQSAFQSSFDRINHLGNMHINICVYIVCTRMFVIGKEDTNNKFDLAHTSRECHTSQCVSFLSVFLSFFFLGLKPKADIGNELPPARPSIILQNGAKNPLCSWCKQARKWDD